MNRTHIRTAAKRVLGIKEMEGHAAKYLITVATADLNEYVAKHSLDMNEVYKSARRIQSRTK